MKKRPAQISLFKRVSHLEKLVFTKHLSVMLKAGIPLGEALSIQVEQAKSQHFKKVLESVLDDVNNGQNLTTSFGKHPKVFDEFYVSLIKVGESSGTLEENLGFLAEQLSKSYNLKKKIQGAMLYPALIFATTLIMGGFISLFVLPKLVDFFEAFEIDLPLTTKILLFVANIMKSYGVFIILGVVALLFLLSLFVNLKGIKPYWHNFILKLPLLGKVFMFSQLATFSRNLGVLLKSGTPITEALETTAVTLSNLRFKNDLVKVKNSISKGQSISEVLGKPQYKEFPPIVVKMINVGEKTGKLDETLLYLADFYEEEIDTIAKNLTVTLEPLLLLCIGLVVGFVAMAIITPIYELTGSIQR